MRLILASASPRRAELLRAAGIDFETAMTDIDEAIRSGETPSAYVLRLASEKSAAAMDGVGAPQAVILGAGTAGWGGTLRAGKDGTRRGPTPSRGWRRDSSRASRGLIRMLSGSPSNPSCGC